MPWAEPPDPDEVRRAADRILADPAYREPQPSLADRALDALGELFGDLFDTLTGSGAGGVVGTVVVVALLVAAGWLLARALSATSGRQRRSAATVGAVVGTSGPPDPDTWAAEAQRLAAAGQHRAALRCRHQELVARLVRAGVVADVPARTPAELVAEVAGVRPDLAPRLTELTDVFERTWYGGVPVDAGGYERFRATAATLAGDAGRTPAARA